MGNIRFLAHLLVALMPGWLVGLLNPGRDRYRGNQIDAKAFAVGRLANLIRTPGQLPTVEESREQLINSVEKLDAKAPPIAEIRDITLSGPGGDVPARLYRDRTDGPSPAMVYYHGGGFIQGNLDSHHQTCAKLAKWWGGTVISVDYRLAPEHPYPAGVDDAISTYRDVVNRAGELGLDPNNIGVGGDSAGGCFAAVVCQQIKITGGPMPKFQVLIYPVTDGNMNLPSISELKDAYILTRERMRWYRDLYAGEFQDFDDPKFSPLLADDFAGLPDCLIITGGFDPLVDDGQAYYDKLKAAGVNVAHHQYSGQVHAFINLTRVVPEGTVALKKTAAWLNKTCA